ncbi:RNA polymerase sigma-70 factor [Prevotella sp. 10(H)]|uniref:RNA polymerase sigma-70 factor n=1 Tax=Prevotella sp. 10(H) TaxID=1158294 RepID=UPI0004A75A1A|nr:RNA polymerase sigma-70 factor [Prevotella sp. 10(H)]
MKNTEKDLILAIKNGDTNAFKSLFFKYSEKLCIWSFNITNNYSVAEDIVQDFFIWYWLNKQNLNFNPSFLSYAYRAVYNSSLNYLRDSSKYIHDCELIIKDIVEETTYHEDDTEELKKSMVKAIDELPERCKKIFVMATIEKKKYTEVANQLGISVNTVKVQVSKAYRILREKICMILF